MDSKLTTRKERDHELTIAAIHETGKLLSIALAHPIGLWLVGKLFLKGVVDPLRIGDESTRVGINQAFDALTATYVAAGIGKDVIPLLPFLRG